MFPSSNNDKLTKQKLVLVLLVRWSPKVRIHLSQRADGKSIALFVDGPVFLAGSSDELVGTRKKKIRQLGSGLERT